MTLEVQGLDRVAVTSAGITKAPVFVCSEKALTIFCIVSGFSVSATP